MNLLHFKLEVNFGENIEIVANNELDLEDYLIERGFKNIKFEDLRKDYGSCYLEDMYGKEKADCHYITKV